MAFPITSIGFCIDILLFYQMNCLHVLVLLVLLIVILLQCIVLFSYSAIVLQASSSNSSQRQYEVDPVTLEGWLLQFTQQGGWVQYPSTKLQGE